MIDRITSLFRGRAELAPDAGHDSAEMQLAAAALLVEAALMDHHFDDAERATVMTVIGRRFDLTEEECARLIVEAEAAATDSHQLYRFTRVIKDRFTPEERIELVEMLWEVAYANGELHHFEDNLLRRIAGLIYVSDRDRGLARKRVLARAGGQ